MSDTQQQPATKKGILNSIGPAIIVAAVVLGPGSILTSSKVGATFGLVGFPVVVGAAVLMIAMVALSARLGAVYENSLCDELAARLGRGWAVFIGLTLFTLVAFFQSSNNVALIGGVEPMFGDDPLSFEARAGVLIFTNVALIACLYLTRNLYRNVESFMKLLMGMMTIAFLINFAVVLLIKPQAFEPVEPTSSPDWLPLLGMIGTTFSVGGAFYQAYLVKEKGWGLAEVREGVRDSVISISMLGIVTSIVLLTSWRVFYGNPDVALKSVGDVARQLEPSFGAAAKIIFCSGILAGALSSFLVNALIGGTIMSDSIGKGSKLSDGWPLHLTVVALLVGMGVAITSLKYEGSTVHLITLAQALTVLGIPALAAALIYLGTRSELTGPRRVPRLFISLAIVGFCVACVLACMTARNVYNKLNPPPISESAAVKLEGS